MAQAEKKTTTSAAVAAPKERSSQVLSPLEEALKAMAPVDSKQVKSTSLSIRLVTDLEPAKTGKKGSPDQIFDIRRIVKTVKGVKMEYLLISSGSNSPRGLAVRPEGGNWTEYIAADAKRPQEARDEAQIMAIAKDPTVVARLVDVPPTGKGKKAHRSVVVIDKTLLRKANGDYGWAGQTKVKGEKKGDPMRWVKAPEVVRTLPNSTKPDVRAVLQHKKVQARNQAKENQKRREAKARESVAAEILVGMQERLDSRRAEVDKATSNGAKVVEVVKCNDGTSVCVVGKGALRRSKTGRGKVEFALYRVAAVVVDKAGKKSAPSQVVQAYGAGWAYSEELNVMTRKLTPAEFTAQGAAAKDPKEVAAQAVRLDQIKSALEKKFPDAPTNTKKTKK